MSVMNTRYGLSDKTWTCGLYHPKGDLNIFLVLLSFFRPFRYGKNDLSRSRGILSPGTPVASMVVYVVVKIRSQIDGFGLIGSGWFFIKISGQQMWSLSQLQPLRIVVLYLFFSRLSRVFAIKICTAIIKEKGRSDHIQHVCTVALVHTWWRWLQLHRIPLPTMSIANIWYAVSKEKRMWNSLGLIDKTQEKCYNIYCLLSLCTILLCTFIFNL